MYTKFAAAAAMLVSVVSFNAQAFPVSPSQSGQGGSIVTLVAQGCGIIKLARIRRADKCANCRSLACA